MKRWIGFAVGMFVGGIVWTTAWAAIPDGGGVIHGCYDAKQGDLSVIDTEAGRTCQRARLHCLGTRPELRVRWELRVPQDLKVPRDLPARNGWRFVECAESGSKYM